MDLRFRTIIQHKTDETEVKAVPNMNSIKLVANKFPIEFKAKTKTKIQIIISMARLDVLFLMFLYLIQKTTISKVFINIEMLSKTRISSNELIFPAQTIL
jgi:hypothetical protein